jgi:hypothetical protein
MLGHNVRMPEKSSLTLCQADQAQSRFRGDRGRTRFRQGSARPAAMTGETPEWVLGISLFMALLPWLKNIR